MRFFEDRSKRPNWLFYQWCEPRLCCVSTVFIIVILLVIISWYIYYILAYAVVVVVVVAINRRADGCVIRRMFRPYVQQYTTIYNELNFERSAFLLLCVCVCFFLFSSYYHNRLT